MNELEKRLKKNIENLQKQIDNINSTTTNQNDTQNLDSLQI